MTILTSDLISQAKSYILSSHRDVQNTLSANYTAGGTSLTLTYPLVGAGAGAFVAIDLEIFQVFAVNTAAQTLTVIGAQLGSTAANHSSGSIVFFNPEVTDFQLLREINADLDSLSSPQNGLFQVKTVVLTYNAAVQGYDLAADIIDKPLSVCFHEPGIGQVWPTLPRNCYAVKRNMDTTVFPSGVALVLYRTANPGRPIRVTYKAAFNHLAAYTDDVVATSGLSASAADLPSLGAAMRLTGMLDVKRNLMGSQSDTRRSAEVPAGSNLHAATWLAGERKRRVIDEANRLQRMYPIIRRRR